jgi:hypothetical protein
MNEQTTTEPGTEDRDRAVVYLFNELDAALRREPLPTSAGGRRYADPGEFMLMRIEGGGGSLLELRQASFKHCFTRNYIYLKRHGSSWRLSVPKTDVPFFRGFFDSDA